MGTSALGSRAIWRGGWSAVLAAAAFGITIPFVQRFGKDTGPFLTAGFLYLGAALGSYRWFGRRSDHEAPVRRAHWPRLLTVAVLGAVLAPASLAWGLQHTGAASASLLLNFEAALTLFLAAIVYREPIGRRVAVAAALMVLGGSALVMGQRDHANNAILGMIAIVAATMCWALDNTVTRPLAELNLIQVVKLKSSVGALLAFSAALILREPLAALPSLFGLILCGTTGYGVSLRLYLRAQRTIGAGRTASIFAVAPFIGAIASWTMGDRTAGFTTLGAAFLFALAIYLHWTEQHEHNHTHDVLVHEHAHRHDDAHHDHVHHPQVLGEHSHPHQHARVTHSHEHGPDAHHRHSHD